MQPIDALTHAINSAQGNTIRLTRSDAMALLRSFKMPTQQQKLLAEFEAHGTLTPAQVANAIGATKPNAVWTAISRLRDCLGEDRRIVTERDGYRLIVVKEDK